MRFDTLVNMNYFQFLLIDLQQNFSEFIQDYPIIEEQMQNIELQLETTVTERDDCAQNYNIKNSNLSECLYQKL